MRLIYSMENLCPLRIDGPRFNPSSFNLTILFIKRNKRGIHFYYERWEESKDLHVSHGLWKIVVEISYFGRNIVYNLNDFGLFSGLNWIFNDNKVVGAHACTRAHTRRQERKLMRRIEIQYSIIICWPSLERRNYNARSRVFILLSPLRSWKSREGRRKKKKK